MTKETSISLHLAKVMGLNVHKSNRPSTGEPQRFVNGALYDPFTNRAQWADVVLWSVSDGRWVYVGHNISETGPDAGNVKQARSDGTDESRMAATLEAIALATGWAK